MTPREMPDPVEAAIGCVLDAERAESRLARALSTMS